jgi:phosphoserine phosphatase
VRLSQPVADLLNIPKDHIYANRLLFNEGGEHAGFDPNEYTARSGGKAKAVEEIKKVGEYCHPKKPFEQDVLVRQAI